MYNSPYSQYMAGVGYNPPAPFQNVPQFTPQQPQQMQPQAENRRTNAEWIPVSNIQQVRDHIVQPNQTLYFMNNNIPEFYVKAADNFGTTQLKAFRFSEINPDAVAQNQTNVEPSISRKEMDEYNARLSRLESQIAIINGGMKHEPDYANDES